MTGVRVPLLTMWLPCGLGSTLRSTEPSLLASAVLISTRHTSPPLATTVLCEVATRIYRQGHAGSGELSNSSSGQGLGRHKEPAGSLCRLHLTELLLWDPPCRLPGPSHRHLSRTRATAALGGTGSPLSLLQPTLHSCNDVLCTYLVSYHVTGRMRNI